MSSKLCPQIVLASGSPMRRHLLERLGVRFMVCISGCAENMHLAKITPRALARKLSQEKARCVAKKYHNALVIAADTFGVIGRTMYGKPQSTEEAKRMIKELSGRMHCVITGLTIIDTSSGMEYSSVSETKVWFRAITDKESQWYLNSKDWKGKGAGYTILGRASIFIERIDGEVGTVLGLPLCMLSYGLQKLGYSISDLATTSKKKLLYNTTKKAFNTKHVSYEKYQLRPS